jgi:hypothetical protein
VFKVDFHGPGQVNVGDPIWGTMRHVLMGIENTHDVPGCDCLIKRSSIHSRQELIAVKEFSHDGHWEKQGYSGDLQFHISSG